MRKLFGIIGLLAILLILLAAFSSELAEALPNPPSLLNTSWVGKYEMAYNSGFTSGTMTLIITAQNGALIRGNFKLTTFPEPILFSGIMMDGELRISGMDGIINANLIYDHLGAAPIWKMRGYWHNINSSGGNKYLPHTGWFLLNKK